MHQEVGPGQSCGHRDRTLTREEGDGHIGCSGRFRADPRGRSMHAIDDGVQLRGTATSRAVETVSLWCRSTEGMLSSTRSTPFLFAVLAVGSFLAVFAKVDWCVVRCVFACEQVRLSEETLSLPLQGMVLAFVQCLSRFM
jgi:hypothetical protein